jgi:hypothetical protein
MLNFSNILCGCVEADHCWVDVEEAIRYRLKMVLSGCNGRKEFFKSLDETLVLAICIDAAPRKKRSFYKSMLNITLRIANEGIKFGVRDLVPLGMSTTSENDEESKLVGLEIGKSIEKLRRRIEDGGIEIEGQKFTKVVLVNSSDFSASAKVDGWGNAASTWPCPAIQGINAKSYGPYGNIMGRSIEEEYLFKLWSPDKREDATWEAPGDRPIPISTVSQRKDLFEKCDLKCMMECGKRKGECKSEEDLKKWMKVANRCAIDSGHAQLHEPFFGINFDISTICALHYKTTKVKDILCYGAELVSYWDTVNGKEIVNSKMTAARCGPALDYYFKQLETEKLYKKQLISFAHDARSTIVGNAVKKRSRNVDAKQKTIGRNLEKLAKDSERSTRLIGVMANVVLKQPWKLVSILKNAVLKTSYKGKGGAKKQKELQDEFLTSISAIASMLYTVKRVVLGLSYTSYDKTEIKDMATEYRANAKQLEYIQSLLFATNRTYDILATVAMPDLFDKCAVLGVSPGVLGLLESSESFHNHVKSYNAMPYGMEHVKAFRRKNKMQKRKTWSNQVMQKIYLVNIYKNTRQDAFAPYKENSKSSKLSRVKDLKKTPYFDSGGCPCGRKETNSQCDACKLPAIKEIMDLSKKCADILIDYNKKEKDDSEARPEQAGNIWTRWETLNDKNWCKFIKGNLDVSKDNSF